MVDYLVFWFRMIGFALRGGLRFYLWIGSLCAVLAFGVYHYIDHLTEGLVVTNMTDSVSWGIGIANFVYFVGVAAAASILVTPAYVYHRKDIKEVVLLGEILAFVAIVLCLLFIVTDLGHPERMLHLIPPFGRLNLPSSLLSWDVVVINGYLFLNLHIPGYLLWKRYRAEEPQPAAYLPFVFVSIGWALTIHVVTAFLLSGLHSRHFWNTPILAPRFLISAGASGPALLTLIFMVVRSQTAMHVKDGVFDYLRQVLKVTMPINLFLLSCEVFHEFYAGSLSSESAHYLYFGLHGHNLLTKYIWTAIGLNTIATVLLHARRVPTRSPLHLIACGLTVTGVWIEKGMGLIFPGFIPTPLGQIVEYQPSGGEIAVNFGVLALGALLFTLMAKVIIGIQTGQLRMRGRESLPPLSVPSRPPVRPPPATAPAPP